METTITDKTVAIEILKQLGGHSFIAMTGARNFISTINSLSFMLPNQKGMNPNYIKIELQLNDTYDIEFNKFGIKYGVIKLGWSRGVYTDNLISIIENKTGLSLNLK